MKSQQEQDLIWERQHASESQAQQKAPGPPFCEAGETKVSDLQGASKEMYESMSEDELEELASTQRKGKPEHKRIS